MALVESNNYLTWNLFVSNWLTRTSDAAFLIPIAYTAAGSGTLYSYLVQGRTNNTLAGKE